MIDKELVEMLSLPELYDDFRLKIMGGINNSGNHILCKRCYGIIEYSKVDFSFKCSNCYLKFNRNTIENSVIKINMESLEAAISLFRKEFDIIVSHEHKNEYTIPQLKTLHITFTNSFDTLYKVLLAYYVFLEYKKIWNGEWCDV